ncbi:unnamed protein product [Paramecium pentaurelia]|uniref:Transmembrane protein n=1 Tax=Paramecium pentaurelia TaxID=43138 RepID=A0A8S1YD84_9CILI|nr:unnamed protein product [Paramecium pentaurelia]
MQQVKYPQFDIQSSNQQDNLQHQLFQNTTEDIRYLPIVQQQTQNSQNYQQVVHPYSEQVNKYQNYYQLDQPPQPTNSLLLKDADFLTQKFFFSSILGMFVIWSFLFALLFFIMMVIFERKLYKHKNEYPLWITVCVIVLILLVKIGSMEKFRYAGLTLVLYFGSIIAYTLTFFFLIAYFSTTPGSDVPSTFIAGVFMFLPLFANLIVTIILLMYILIETKKFRFYKVFVCEFLCVLPFAIIDFKTLICLVILLPYTFLLLNVLKQIQKGRFNLHKDQVLSGTLAAYYGVLMPFD